MHKTKHPKPTLESYTRPCGCTNYQVCPHEDPDTHARLLKQSTVPLDLASFPLARKLNDEFDPTNAMHIASLAMILMRHCERIYLDKHVTDYSLETMRVKMNHLASAIFPALSADDLHMMLERELAALGSVR